MDWKPDASVLIAYRQSDPYRLRNLLAVVEQIKKAGNLQIIIVEQDSEPRLDHAVLDDGVSLLFQEQAGLFNKSRALNAAAKKADADVLVIADADLILDPLALVGAIRFCSDKKSCVNPYDRLVDLTREESERYLAGNGLPRTRMSTKPNREGIGEYICFCGGLFVIPCKTFFDIGGMDEAFIGWGGEDDAMTVKLMGLEVPCLQVSNRVAFHLWHPRPPGLRYGHAHYLDTCTRLEMYRRGTRKDLEELATSTGIDARRS